MRDTLKKLTCFGILCVVAFGLMAPAMGKRKAPEKLAPVIFGDSVFTPSTETCGLVVQTNRKSGKVVRRIRFYQVVYLPLLERDAQDVWLTDFFRLGDDLWARDEKGRIYTMLLKTMKPRRVKYLTEAEFEDLKKAANP